MSTWENNLILYDALVDTCRGFKRKGKTMPYTSANGYMFSLLNKEGQFGIRLPKNKAQEFRDKYETKEFKSQGAVMKDYVHVPDELLQDPKVLTAYLKASFKYVMSLPSK